MAEAEAAPSTTTETTEAPEAAPAAPAAPKAGKVSRAERLAKLQEKVDATAPKDADEEDDSEEPAKEGEAKPALEEAKPPEPDPREERLARIEALAAAEAEAAKATVEGKRYRAEFETVSKERDHYKGIVEKFDEAINNPRLLLQQLRRVAKDDEIQNLWFELQDPRALAEHHASTAAQRVESAAMREIEALKQQLRERDEGARAHAEAVAKANEIFSLTETYAAKVPLAAHLLGQGRHAYVEACASIEDVLRGEGVEPTPERIVQRLDELLRIVQATPNASPAVASTSSTKPSTNPGSVTGRPAPGPAITNAVASESSAVELKKLPRAERLKALRARFG